MTATQTPMSKAEVRDALRLIVADKPEGYVYAKHSPQGDNLGGACNYRHPETNAPDCIVGCFIAQQGQDLSLAQEGMNAYAVLKDNFPNLVTEASRVYLDEVQSQQDRGETWADAVEGAY